MLGLLGYGYAVAGKRDQAQAILKELDELQTRQYVSSAEIAFIYIGLEEREQAFVWLEKAYHERAWLLGFLKVEPVFDSLRSDHAHERCGASGLLTIDLCESIHRL